MAPILGRRELAPTTITTLIVVGSIGAVALITIAVFFIVDRLRSNQYRIACQKDPYLTRREFNRRRRLNPFQRLREEEQQRDFILRKTLDSRGSFTSDPSIAELGQEKPSRSGWRGWQPHFWPTRAEEGESRPFLGGNTVSENGPYYVPAHQRRSSSPTGRALLANDGEPSRERSGFWSRRPNTLQPAELPVPSRAPSPQRDSAPDDTQTAYSTQEIIIQYSPPPPQHPQHDLSTDGDRQQQPSQQRPVPEPLILLPRSMSPAPQKSPLPPVPSVERDRSNSISAIPFPDLAPPPTARTPSPSPRRNEFLLPIVSPPLQTLQRDRALSWDQGQGRDRSRSNELIVPGWERVPIPYPSQSPRNTPGPPRKASKAPVHIASLMRERSRSVEAPPKYEETQGMALSVPRTPSPAPSQSPRRKPVPERSRLPTRPAAQPSHVSPGLQKQQTPRPESHRSEEDLENESQLKELGLLPKTYQRPRSAEPPANLPVPRMQRDRSRSFESRPVQLPHLAAQTTRRDRSHSFESRLPPMRPGQGQWELQVSILDQTGAPSLRRSPEMRPQVEVADVPTQLGTLATVKHVDDSPSVTDSPLMSANFASPKVSTPSPLSPPQHSPPLFISAAFKGTAMPGSAHRVPPPLFVSADFMRIQGAERQRAMPSEQPRQAPRSQPGEAGAAQRGPQPPCASADQGPAQKHRSERRQRAASHQVPPRKDNRAIACTFRLSGPPDLTPNSPNFF